MSRCETAQPREKYTVCVVCVCTHVCVCACVCWGRRKHSKVDLEIESQLSSVQSLSHV